MGRLSEPAVSPISIDGETKLLQNLYTLAYSISFVFAGASVIVFFTGLTRDEVILRSLGATGAAAFAITAMLLDHAKARLSPEDPE